MDEYIRRVGVAQWYRTGFVVRVRVSMWQLGFPLHCVKREIIEQFEYSLTKYQYNHLETMATHTHTLTHTHTHTHTQTMK